MVFKIFLCLHCILTLIPSSALCLGSTVVLGRWSTTEVEQMIMSARLIDNSGDRIASLSRHFIDAPYLENTLIGDQHTPEQLVLNLSGFDCFTYLDIVEALRRAQDFDDLSKALQEVRYRDGKVTYANRRHFFSDWVSDDVSQIVDVTESVGRGRAQVVVKHLNLKSDGNFWLSEVPVVRREIAYIPTHMIDPVVLSALKSGDYVGVFSDQPGLDVSHTGLIVKINNRILLRHASSQQGVRRVVDVDLWQYLSGKPGLVVYRVK